MQRRLELATASSVGGALGLGREPETPLPHQLAPGEPEPITAADPHECFDRRSFESRRSPSYEIADALEWSVALSLFDGGCRGFFTPMPHESQSNAHCSLLPAPCSRFNRAPDVAAIEVG